MVPLFVSAGFAAIETVAPFSSVSVPELVARPERASGNVPPW